MSGLIYNGQNVKVMTYDNKKVIRAIYNGKVLFEEPTID